jgi:putative Mn2+ efflux pump MntP
MEWFSLLGLALGLAMDALAVAIVAGLSLDPLTRRQIFRLAFHFGLFQAIMPVAGWFAGTVIQKYLADIDHWVALALLGFVGGKMILGALKGDEKDRLARDPTVGWQLIFLSVATSIDALAVGFSLAVIGSTIMLPALVIGLVAATLTTVGMLAGRRMGSMWGKRVEILGGIILIGIGLKIVSEHLR